MKKGNLEEDSDRELDAHCNGDFEDFLGNVLLESSVEFWIEKGKFGEVFGYGFGWIVMVILRER